MAFQARTRSCFRSVVLWLIAVAAEVGCTPDVNRMFGGPQARLRPNGLALLGLHGGMKPLFCCWYGLLCSTACWRVLHWEYSGVLVCRGQLPTGFGTCRLHASREATSH